MSEGNREIKILSQLQGINGIQKISKTMVSFFKIILLEADLCNISGILQFK